MEINTLGVKPRGSWPYSIVQNMLFIEFYAEKKRIKELFLPDPLKPIGNGDTLGIGFVDSAFPSLREVDGEIPDPDGTEFCECSMGVPCEYNGKKSWMYTWLWLDHYAGALRRGYNRSVLDSFARTKTHPMLEGEEELKPGVKMFANVTHWGELFAKCSFECTKIHDDPNKFLDDYYFSWGQIRYLPDYSCGDNIAPLVNTASIYHFPPGLKVSKIYEGNATLEFGDMQNSLLKSLGTPKVKKAYFLTFAYTYASEELLCDLENRNWRFV